MIYCLPNNCSPKSLSRAFRPTDPVGDQRGAELGARTFSSVVLCHARKRTKRISVGMYAHGTTLLPGQKVITLSTYFQGWTYGGATPAPFNQPTQRVAEKHTCTCALDMERPHSTSGAFFAHYSPSAPLTDNPSLLNRSLLYILRINFTRSGLEFLVPMRSLAACQVNEK